jgi:site-specific recombinase XerC
MRLPIDSSSLTFIAGSEPAAVLDMERRPRADKATGEVLWRLDVVALGGEDGGAKLSEIRRADVQALIDRLMTEGHGASTIRNTLLPLRVIFRRALVRGEVAVNPTMGLELPAVRGRRDRIASPSEAARLLAALDRDQVLWATAV